MKARVLKTKKLYSLKSKKSRSLKCEKCGNYFLCYGTEGFDCWCFNITNVKISSEIKDCLCKECLK